MIETAALNMAFKLILWILLIVGGRMFLIWMDKVLMPRKFRQWLENADDLSRAIYFGSRLIALFIAGAIVLG